MQTDTGEIEEGRWLRIKIPNALNEPLNIWVMYAPTKAKNSNEWIKEFGKEL